MRLFSRKSLLFFAVGTTFLCALLLIGATQSTQAHAASVSSTIITPYKVPLPDNTHFNSLVHVRTDGEFANRWNYTVNNTRPGDVVDFYHDNMSGHGWNQVWQSAAGPHGGRLIKYTQGNRICYVDAHIAANDNNTTLVVTVTN